MDKLKTKIIHELDGLLYFSFFAMPVGINEILIHLLNPKTDNGTFLIFIISIAIPITLTIRMWLKRENEIQELKNKIYILEYKLNKGGDKDASL